MNNFDFIIVGAGNAGLSAALNCVKSGYKTLLIEQHNMPGGCATSFCRGRFEFEPSLHELCGVGTEKLPGEIRSLFNKYEIDVKWIELDECFRIISKYSDGTLMDVTMPAGRQPFIDKMEYYVPGSKGKISKLFALFDEIEEGLMYVSNENNRNVKELIQKYPNMLRTGAFSTIKVFKAMKLPQKCIDILSTYWSYLGVDLYHLSFAHYASMINSYITKGACIPSHTSHEISTKLLEKYRENGGQIWFNCKALNFKFENENITGINTTNGYISAKYILANINPDIVYGGMIPQKHIPERIKKIFSARKQKYSGRMFTVYLGLNKSINELGIKNYSIFLSESSDSKIEYSNMMKNFETNNYVIFNCLNVVNPEASPEGTCVCSFTTFMGPDDWENINEENYEELKHNFALKIINNLKIKTGIDILDSIEEISIATPWTFARYLGTPEGSVYGYETRDWDNVFGRTMLLKNDYPIKHLKTIGAAGSRGVGYNSAYLCGYAMSNKAISELNDEDYNK